MEVQAVSCKHNVQEVNAPFAPVEPIVLQQQHYPVENAGSLLSVEKPH